MRQPRTLSHYNIKIKKRGEINEKDSMIKSVCDRKPYSSLTIHSIDTHYG